MQKDSKVQDLESIVANLQLPPPERSVDYTGRHVVHGDLHANPLRMIYLLMLIGVMKLSKEKYVFLADFLTKHCPQLAEDPSLSNFLGELVHPKKCSLDEFKIRLNQPAINKFKEARTLFRSTLGLDSPKQKAKKSDAAVASKKRCAHITDIGDTVADRGPDDRFMLDLNEWRHVNGIKFTIMLSNHDAFSFGAWHVMFLSNPFKMPRTRKAFRKLLLTDPYMLEQLIFTHSPSLNNSLYSLLGQPSDRAFLSAMLQLERQVKTYFLPNLHLMKAEMTSQGRVVVNTHTPAPESLFIELAKLFNVDWKSDTDEDVFESVNHINSRFRSALQKSPEKIHQYLDSEEGALFRFINYRPSEGLSVVKTLPGKGIHNFGHIGEGGVDRGQNSFEVNNLDTWLGKVASVATEDHPLKIFSFFPESNKSPKALNMQKLESGQSVTKVAMG